MKRLFISTTNHIDNGKAVAYYGVVSSHLVAGTGFLSDFAASFSDFFGGRSKSYRRQMESLYDEALDELSEKARLMGANSVLGLKIEVDNIAAKGMSMFMITAVGTAAKIEYDQSAQEEGRPEAVSSAALIHEMEKRAILKNLEDKDAVLPSKSWEYILKSPDNDYVGPLTRRYYEVMEHYNDYDADYRSKFVDNFASFFSMVERDQALKVVYDGLYYESSQTTAVDLIKDHQLFDAKSIQKLVDEKYIRVAVSLLSVEQPSYTESDLHDMEALAEMFDHLPDLGKIELVKAGMFGKESEKYICRHGHQNDPQEEYCLDCRENIKGLTLNDLQEIEKYKNRISVLKDLLSQ